MLVFTLFHCFYALGQCPSGTITLTTQSDIDNFKINYPSCIEFNGSITITDNISINNLEGLSNLTTINGDLTIGSNGRFARSNRLLNLEGLQNLTHVGGTLALYNNNFLQNIQHLSNLEHVGDNLILESNWYLDHFLGLENVTIIHGNLIIKDNREVRSLMGLQNISEVVGNLEIFNTIENNGIQGLNGVTKVGGNLELYYVHGLSDPNNTLPNLEEVVGGIHIVASDEPEEIAGFNKLGRVQSISIRLNKARDITGFNALTKIEGIVFKTNRELIDISGFHSLSNINSIEIDDHTKLRSISSLTNLDSINYLNIVRTGFVNFNEFNSLRHAKSIKFEDNFFLESLDGFSSLISVENDLIIRNSDRLFSIIGFSNLTQVRTLSLLDNEILNNVTGFQALRTISNGFSLGKNKNLTDLEGFSNVETVGSFDITENESLVDFKKLSSLENTNGLFRIQGNTTLESLEGLEKLNALGSVNIIKNNPNLKTLKGLENLVAIFPVNDAGSLEIVNNSLLEDIRAIGNIWHEGYQTIEIGRNPLLKICNNDNICGKITQNNPSLLSIYDNAPGCNNLDEVALSCNLNTLEGTIKLNTKDDDCVNGIGMNNIRIETSDGNLTAYTFTDDNGMFSFKLPNGNFQTTVILDPGLMLLNPPIQTTTFSRGDTIEIINFCTTATTSFNDLKISIVPPEEARPGFEASYVLVYENMGTLPMSGTISFQFDDSKLSYLGADITETRRNLDILEWDFSDLNPFQKKKIVITFIVEAPPIANIGEEISFGSSIIPQENERLPEDNTFYLKQTLVGSYDPNDIRVLEGEEVNIDNTDEYLNYIIRFQNTGTASAINVKIDHELDADLDWETFTPISSSHLNITTITDGKDVEFLFENINLPDSTANEPASHGHVAFKIKPKTDVAVGDVVRGSASIYFDFNPPIITNTVSTKIVDDKASLVSDALIISPVSCAGETDAAIQVTAMGGNEPYMYELLDENHNTLIAPQANNILNGIGAGHYNIRVVDGSGEKSVFEITLQDPLPMSLNYTLSDINCNGASDGRIEVLVSGGTAPYIYSMNGEAYRESGVFKHLAPGLYSIEVIDANGCYQYLPSIGVQEHLELTMAVTLQDVLCKGATDGEIEITAAGGFAPYLFSLNESIYQSNNVFSNLLAGQYTVEILDANGCIISNQVVISELNSLDFDNDGIGDDCDDDVDGDGIANDTDDCAETPLDTEVDASGCAEFTLSSTNFTVQTNSETCASSNNGSILVTAAENLDYIATLASGSDVKSKVFRTFTSFQDLVAGHYDVCVTVAGQAGFERCFSVQITEPEPLNVDSKVDVTGKSVSLKMRGGAHYTITLNGQTHTTSESEITLPIFTIENRLSVKTDQDCQGVFKEAFYVNVSNISIYPNPVSDGELSVLVPSEPDEKVYFSLFTNSGRLVLQNAFENTENPFKLNVSRLTSGTYNLKIETESRTDFRRIIIK